MIDPSTKGFIQETFKMYTTGTHTYMSIAKELGSKGFIGKRGLPITWTNIESILKMKHTPDIRR